MYNAIFTVYSGNTMETRTVDCRSRIPTAPAWMQMTMVTYCYTLETERKHTLTRSLIDEHTTEGKRLDSILINVRATNTAFNTGKELLRGRLGSNLVVAKVRNLALGSDQKLQRKKWDSNLVGANVRNLALGSEQE